MLSSKLSLPSPENALPGRDSPMVIENKHFVHGRPIQGPFDEHLETIYLGLGCFWGAERKFWTMDGVYTTAVGYGAGLTPNPSYEEVCSGLTGHNELVLVVFNPADITFSTLLSTFFEAHNPTQGMRQGNDQGTQYRSGIYCTTSEQEKLAQHALQQYQIALEQAQLKAQITTEILSAPAFYYAEQYHQQYLAKNPNGYCGIGGVGVSCVL